MTVTARHRRPRATRYSKLAVGAAAAGTMVLVPSVAKADPQPTIDQVKTQLDKLYQQAADANEAYNTAKDAQGKLQQQVDGINKEMSAEQASMAQTQTRLGGLAAAQYRSGNIDPTLQIMVQADPGTLLNMSATIDRVTANGADTLKLLAQQKADLAAKAKEAADKMALLDRNTKDAEAKKKQFDGDVTKAQNLLNSLQADQRAALEAQRAREQAAAVQAAKDAAAKQTASSGSTGGSSGSTSVSIPPVSGRAAAAVAFAKSQLGKPYIFGATGPGGYDCSGLTQAAWKAAGVTIPRTATAQMQGLRAIPASSAQPGDLVFFYGDSSYVNHVGMYIGNGLVIHAPRPGSTVSVAAVSTMPVVSYARPA
ncbi:C40 family peptidase [Catenulispora subtropica]|uniref:C40 family peptidase n=1 Tax=Catenulispora subtropica TaxID=450798 RepID=A0ABN2SPK2_9ACTN